MTVMYYAVYGTNRADLSEWVVALLSTEALARVVGWEILDARPWLIRCRVCRVHLSRRRLNEIVERWGREDAARGRPITDADKLPPPFRDIYLAVYVDTQHGGDR
jgi:hypothetical protein